MRSLKLDWATLKEGMGLGFCNYLKMNAKIEERKKGRLQGWLAEIFNPGGLVSLDDCFCWTLSEQVHWGTRLYEWAFWVYRLNKYLSSEFISEKMLNVFHVSYFFFLLAPSKYPTDNPVLRKHQRWVCTVCVCRCVPVIVYSLPTKPCRWRPGFLVSALLDVGHC